MDAHFSLARLITGVMADCGAQLLPIWGQIRTNGHSAAVNVRIICDVHFCEAGVERGADYIF